jgi:hypothetical protein
MEKNLTTKNTKQEILDAYEGAVSKIKALESGKLDPIKEAGIKRAETTLSRAEIISAEDVVNPKVIEDYNTMKEAIKIAEDNLKEIYGIEKTAQTLAALINAQSEKRTDFDAELKAKRTDAETEVDAMFDKICESKATWELELKNARLSTEQARKREEEDFKYNLTRARKLDNDKWEDEKKSRESIVSNRETAATTREEQVLERETTLSVLEGKVTQIPTLVKEAADAAYEEGKKAASKDFGFEKRAIEGNFKSEKAILDNKIINLEESVARMTKELELNRIELTAARNEVKEIATKTVEASGNARMVDSLQSMIKDNAKNTK